MNAFHTPHLFLPAVAALALVLCTTPHASAFAEEIGTIDVMQEDVTPQNAAQLRRLLANPIRDAEQQYRLERAMDGVYEELADASDVQVPDKSFIQSVNDLLGVKPHS